MVFTTELLYMFICTFGGVAAGGGLLLLYCIVHRRYRAPLHSDMAHSARRTDDGGGGAEEEKDHSPRFIALLFACVFEECVLC